MFQLHCGPFVWLRLFCVSLFLCGVVTATLHRFDMPRCIPMVHLRRHTATIDTDEDGSSGTGATGRGSESTGSKQRRFNRSLFGQLFSHLSGWGDNFRRNYVFREDKGQGRSFKVQFRGETAQDNGGPYVFWFVRTCWCFCA